MQIKKDYLFGITRYTSSQKATLNVGKYAKYTSGHNCGNSEPLIKYRGGSKWMRNLC